MFARFRQNLPEFCRIFPIRPRRNVQGTRRGGYPEGTRRVPAVRVFAENALYRASKKVSARSSARPSSAAALRDLEALVHALHHEPELLEDLHQADQPHETEQPQQPQNAQKLRGLSATLVHEERVELQDLLCVF